MNGDGRRETWKNRRVKPKAGAPTFPPPQQPPLPLLLPVPHHLANSKSPSPSSERSSAPTGAQALTRVAALLDLKEGPGDRPTLEEERSRNNHASPDHTWAVLTLKSFSLPSLSASDQSDLALPCHSGPSLLFKDKATTYRTVPCPLVSNPEGFCRRLC